MRVKRKLNIGRADRIKGLTSLELADRCPDQRQVFPTSACTNLGCDFSIRQPGYMNCTFVASEAGEHTLEAIGEMMEITREGVRLIEVRAMKKFRERMVDLAKTQDQHEPPISKPGMAARPDHVVSNHESVERQDERHGVRNGARRKLAYG